MIRMCRRLPLATAVLVVTFSSHAADTTAAGAPPTLALNRLAEVLDAAPAASSCTAAICRQSAVLVTEDRIDSLIRSGHLEAAALSGMPVIIINGDGDAAARLARSLGAASRAAVSVHLPSPGEGKLQVFTLEELPEDSATRTMAVTNLLQQVSRWRPPTVSHRRSLQALSDAPRVDVPRLELTVTAVGAVAGNLTTLEATVLRHVTATSSNLRVLMKSTHTLQPYEVIAQGIFVRIPDVYRTMHTVVPTGQLQDSGEWVVGYVPPKLLGWVPQGSSATSFDVSETHATTTGYSLSLSPELAQMLTDAGVKTPLAKVGFTAAFESTNTHSKSISYRVDDYAVGSAAIEQGLRRWQTGFHEGTYEGPPRRLLEWKHSLASFIRNDRNYFFGSGVATPASKITPAMRSLSPQHASSWEVPEHAQSGMELSAGSRIDDVVSLNGYWVQTQPSMAHVRASIFVSPQSVYLTREPTVLLRTLSGAGGCLTAVTSEPDDWQGYDQLKVLPCSEQSLEWVPGAQWQLDNYQRYYNRGADKCLTIQPTRGRRPAPLSLQTCTLASNQVWEWRADRLHNRYDGDAQGYLLLASGDGDVVAAPSSIAVNPHHRLLVPWSNYPASPVQGSFIPSLSGAPQQVPPSWIGVPGVPSSARWELTTLRRPSGG